MAILNLYINTNSPETYIDSDKLTTATELGLLFNRMIAGQAANISLRCDVTPLNAANTVVIDGGSGTVSITIDGVAFSTTADADDVVTATTLATAINASSNALITGIVTAAASDPGDGTGLVTITAVIKGKTGNAITTAAAGTGMTATGARLIAGSNGTTTSFTY